MDKIKVNDELIKEISAQVDFSTTDGQANEVAFQATMMNLDSLELKAKMLGLKTHWCLEYKLGKKVLCIIDNNDNLRILANAKFVQEDDWDTFSRIQWDNKLNRIKDVTLDTDDIESAYGDGD